MSECDLEEDARNRIGIRDSMLHLLNDTRLDRCIQGLHGVATNSTGQERLQRTRAVQDEPLGVLVESLAAQLVAQVLEFTL